MTLPFSEKPERSAVYQDLKTETLHGLTADQFDQLRSRMFSMGVNGLEDEYRRLVLLGLASDKLSVSGPIPKTGQVITQAVSTSGGSPTLAFTPGNGEVYQVNGVSIDADGVSGSVTYEVYISDDASFSVSTALFLIKFSSTSSRIPLNEQQLAPIIIDENTPLYVEATGTFTNVNFNISMIRLR